MRAKTAEMIHQFRKQRNITQQHLADVIGVSVGTVSKWENGITEPDLSLLMDIAAYCELLRLIEVGASYFNHYCTGCDFSQRSVLHNVHRRIRLGYSIPTFCLSS